MRHSLALLLLLAALPAQAQGSEGPYFIYLGSFSAKALAQEHAARHGGWVLRTDLYRGLTPGFFAAVRGPFYARADADAALASVAVDLPDAQVRAAGEAVLPRALGDAALLAAVLGDLVADVTSAADAIEPCAPVEPHLAVLVGFAQTHGRDDDAPAAGFWLVERTGEVRPMSRCDE